MLLSSTTILLKMRVIENRRILWPVLSLIAGIPRILGAFFLPNTFGDAYVYIRDIGILSTKIKAGTFGLNDLYGFWLPLYQFISAVLNVGVRNGFYAGKVVAALFGIGVALLVYAITFRLAENKAAAFLAFLLIAVNPLHLQNSTSALTDVPHAFFVLAAVYFILQKRWILAAIFAALAGLTRVESWMFLALLPLIQLIRERRISIATILILIVPPLFWLYISWRATGDWLACFRSRQQYHDWLLVQNPSLAHFSLAGVGKDITSFVSGADLAVLLAAFAAAWIILRRLRTRKEPGESLIGHDSFEVDSVLPLVVVFFAFFALLLVAYLTHQQPIIFPRYVLILFSVGIPILAWTYLQISNHRPDWSRRLLITIVVLCALNWSAQLTAAFGELRRYSAQRRVADYLHDHFDNKSDAKIFCDEDTVRVLSGITPEHFLTSADAPATPQAFAGFLNSKVSFLVYANRQGSIAITALPDVESRAPDGYCVALHSQTNFLLTNIWVFQRCKTR